MNRRKIVVPPQTRADQGRASDPGASAWVSAHAGSGKTHVLAQRVIRLLLRGVPPSRILCLTYTKAAAANMSNRVFGTLAGWTRLSDEELGDRLAEMEGERPGRHLLARARRLFAEALETPGGLKIQTIHAFCEAVLHQFPLEANIAGHFELLDSEMEAALVAEARRELIAGAADGHDRLLADAFAEVLSHAHEHGLNELLTAIVAQRDGIAAFIAEVAGPERRFDALFSAFGFSGTETVDGLLKEVWPHPYFCRALAQSIGDRAAGERAVKAGKFAAELQELCGRQDPTEIAQVLSSLFLTKKKGEPRGPKSSKGVLAKSIAQDFPGFEEEFQRMAGAVARTCDRIALLEMLRATAAALALADRLLAIYGRLKSARGFLDFNDLIARTAALLARQDAGAWVQYKLDRGIDHILLDEAQDTSPAQWAVIRALAAEFFAGAGAGEERDRSIFAVGDEKQSIYSFQGADPDAFDESRHGFQSLAGAARRRFEFVRLSQSFRSVEDVLRAVDQVFADPGTRAGVTRDEIPIVHTALRIGEPGEVQLWPLVGAQAVDAPEDWTQSIDHAKAPTVVVAEAIAGTISGWLAQGQRLGGSGKLIDPGDILVLVRKRDAFMHALSRALKNRNIPVAGADRLGLSDHIAVKDLLALARIALQPEDDLSLAALLKSPLFGIDEDTLMALAAGRKGASLLQSLRRAAGEEPALEGFVRQLDGWREEAQRLAPFDFFARVLGRDHGRRKLIARLGHEASDVLDEFLSFCLAVERTGLAGLEALVAVLQEGGREIKREMDQTRGEVRIMTAHAAKGLEAPIVFLVDGGSAPYSHNHAPKLMPADPPKGGWRGRGYFWRPSAAQDNDVYQRAAGEVRRKAEEEYRRLLYVAMTRAEDRLIVCGYHGKRSPDDRIWHCAVERALRQSEHAVPFQHPLLGEGALRFRSSPPCPAAAVTDETDPASEQDPMPAVLGAKLPPPPVLPRPLTPSAASLAVEPAPVAAAASPVLTEESSNFALERGLAVHRLLQVLPDLDRADPSDSLLRHLSVTCPGWTQEQRAAVRDEVLKVCDAPEFRGLFAMTSRPEVSVLGTIEVAGTPRTVSGKIDRLFVGEEQAVILDYKTNRPAPARLDEVPEDHVAQLAIYAALVGRIYPRHTVRAMLLYTHAPSLIELPQKRMAAAVAALGRVGEPA